MKILAIETSTRNCSVALRTLQQTFHRSKLATREQSQLILPMINELLLEAGITLDQLDAIALSVGPGSFTGLRLGMGVAQGLAFAKHIPVIPVSSLAVWAQSAYRTVGAKQIMVAVNAYMGEVYLGRYKIDNQGVALIIEPDALIKPDEVLALTLSNYVGIGDAWQACSILAESKSSLQANHDELPDALALLSLALKNQDKQEDITNISLNYLRDETAWKTVAQQMGE